DRVIHHRRRDIDDASAGLLSQHLLDRKLCDEEKTFDIDGNERPQILNRVIREVFREKYAGVVNERIDPVESGYSSIGDLCRRVWITDVSIDQGEIRRRRKWICFSDVSRICYHGVTAIQKRLHKTCSNALRATGHDNCFVRR